MSERPAARWTLVGAVLLAAALPATALETDQFAAWRKPLADSGPAINAKINLEIERAVDEMNRSTGEVGAEEMARAVRRRLHFEIFHPIELWAVQSPLVDGSPRRGEEEAHYLRNSIYRRSHPWDIAMWMPLSPTIAVNGIRFGTDKLAHFISSGWRYRHAYLRRLRRGETPERAEEAAIRWGILEEESVTGTLASGIFSRPDLEADYAGMRFYLGLCGGPDPILEKVDGKWRLRRPYDIRTAVTPEWDESYLLPVYHRGRWSRVRPEIAAMCGELDDPVVRARFAAYRARDTLTPTERVLDELSREGKLPDMTAYSLAAICPQAATLPPAPAQPVQPALADPPLSPDLTAGVVSLDGDRERRTYGLWRGGWSHPLSLSATLGAVLTSLPRTTDCRSLCEIRGVTAHVSAGLTGGELAVGWTRLFAATGPGRHFIADVSLALGVRAAVMRTWGSSPLDPKAQTLAGIEGAVSVVRVSFTLGVFAPVGGGGARDHRVVTGSVGFGF